MDPMDIGSPDFEEYDDVDVKGEERYEDAGELDLSTAHNDLLLTRMPKITWEALSHLKDDDEVRVGTIRIQGDRQNPAKVSLMLDPTVSALRLVPREYNLRTMSKSSANTFVFTEKDLPGYTRKIAGQGTQAGRPQPVEKKEGNPGGRSFRMPGYRRAIPKKTALSGHVTSEFNCLPVENQEYVKILSKRQAEQPKIDTAPTFFEGRVGMGSILNPGGGGATNSFTGFIRTAPQREKKQQLKAARMPKNELIDLLLTYFRQYKYWYLKDLKLKTQQPDTYLREMLQEIADQVKQGPLNGTWALKADMMMGQDSFEGASATVAPTIPGSEMVSEGEDDGGHVKREVKMEDGV